MVGTGDADSNLALLPRPPLTSPGERRTQEDSGQGGRWRGSKSCSPHALAGRAGRAGVPTVSEFAAHCTLREDEAAARGAVFLTWGGFFPGDVG